MSSLGAIRRAGSLLVLVAMASPASAQSKSNDPSGHTFRLDYEAAPGCPSAAEFAAGILERSKRITFDPGGKTALVVLLERDADRYRGTVRQREAELDRQVEATSCSDAAFGLTMVALIAFDPDARLDAEEPAPTPSPSPAEREAPPPNVTRPEPAVPVARLAPKREKTSLWEVGVAPRVQVGDVGDFGWGAEFDATRTDAARSLAWLMGLDFVTSSIEAGGWNARLFQVGGFGALCPSLTNRGTLFACGGVEVAALTAQTSNSATLDAEPTSIRALFAPTAMLGFQSDIAPTWSFFARAGVAYHMMTYDFGVTRADATTTSVFEQSRVAGRLSIGVAHDL